MHESMQLPAALHWAIRLQAHRILAGICKSNHVTRMPEADGRAIILQNAVDADCMHTTQSLGRTTSIASTNTLSTKRWPNQQHFGSTCKSSYLT